MLVQKALHELDGEIERLSRIRAIVAGLHSSFSSAEFATAQDAEAVDTTAALTGDPAERAGGPAALEIVPKRAARKLRFERSSRTRRPAPPMARALGGAIPPKPVFIASGNGKNGAPAAPVVVAAAKERGAVEPPAEGLEALMREVSFRRNAQRA